ncbi:unnamed protein product [Closterium sp. NIES-64]|nr:unnamed protein product [Closterium sp. NIES-64]
MGAGGKGGGEGGGGGGGWGCGEQPRAGYCRCCCGAAEHMGRRRTWRGLKSRGSSGQAQGGRQGGKRAEGEVEAGGVGWEGLLLESLGRAGAAAAGGGSGRGAAGGRSRGRGRAREDLGGGLILESLSSFSSARANVCVYSGRWQYEATLGSSGIQQIGWATLACPFTAEEGVGTRPTRMLLMGRECGSGVGWSAQYGQPWAAHDVRKPLLLPVVAGGAGAGGPPASASGGRSSGAGGAAAGAAGRAAGGTAVGKVTFYRNGECLAFTGVKALQRGLGLFPSHLNLHGERCQLNFGARPFRYPVTSLPPSLPFQTCPLGPDDEVLLAKLLCERLGPLLLAGGARMEVQRQMGRRAGDGKVGGGVERVWGQCEGGYAGWWDVDPGNSRRQRELGRGSQGVGGSGGVGGLGAGVERGERGEGLGEARGEGSGREGEAEGMDVDLHVGETEREHTRGGEAERRAWAEEEEEEEREEGEGEEEEDESEEVSMLPWARAPSGATRSKWRERQEVSSALGSSSSSSSADTADTNAAIPAGGYLQRHGRWKFPVAFFLHPDLHYFDLPRLGGLFSHVAKTFPLSALQDFASVAWSDDDVDDDHWAAGEEGEGEAGGGTEERRREERGTGGGGTGEGGGAGGGRRAEGVQEREMGGGRSEGDGEREGEERVEEKAERGKGEEDEREVLLLDMAVLLSHLRGAGAFKQAALQQQGMVQAVAQLEDADRQIAAAMGGAHGGSCCHGGAHGGSWDRRRGRHRVRRVAGEEEGAVVGAAGTGAAVGAEAPAVTATVGLVGAPGGGTAAAEARGGTSGGGTSRVGVGGSVRAQQLREARQVFREDVDESVRLAVWWRVVLGGATWKQRALVGVSRRVGSLLLAASKRGHIFAYEPEVYLEAMLLLPASKRGHIFAYVPEGFWKPGGLLSEALTKAIGRNTRRAKSGDLGRIYPYLLPWSGDGASFDSFLFIPPSASATLTPSLPPFPPPLFPHPFSPMPPCPPCRRVPHVAVSPMSPCPPCRRVPHVAVSPMPPCPPCRRVPHRSFLLTRFSDARIPNPDTRDQLLQTLSVLLQLPPFSVALETNKAACTCFMPSLLNAFDQRFWIPVSQLYLHHPSLFSPFFNRLFNTLNWTLTEFLVALKEVQDLQQQEEQRWRRNRRQQQQQQQQQQAWELQQRKCSVMFDLTCNLARLLEVLCEASPEVFLSLKGGGGQEKGEKALEGGEAGGAAAAAEEEEREEKEEVKERCKEFQEEKRGAGPGFVQGHASPSDRSSCPMDHVSPSDQSSRPMVLAPLVGIIGGLFSHAQRANGSAPAGMVRSVLQADPSLDCLAGLEYLLGLDWVSEKEGSAEGERD